MKYQTRPIVVEAIKFEYTPNGLQEVAAFCGDALISTNKLRHPTAVGEAEIRTLAYRVGGIAEVHFATATEGDYVLKGVTGEFSVISNQVFELMYVAVE